MVSNYAQGYSITLQNILIIMSALICPKLDFWGKIFKFHAKIAKKDSIVVSTFVRVSV